jgi:hypothetical protein
MPYSWINFIILYYYINMFDLNGAKDFLLGEKRRGVGKELVPLLL